MAKTCILLVSCLVVGFPGPVLAQRAWVEAKGPNVTVISDAGEGRARDIAWQFEQVREALALTFPWVRANLSRPLVVLAARGEATMRAMVPTVFERPDGRNYASVSATGRDRAFVALRADLRIDDREGINPYQSAYWAFAAQALGETYSAFPLWFWRGMASVMSNTLVRDREIQIGRTLPGHLQTVRGQGRLALRELVGLADDDPRLKRPEFLGDLDGNAWAFVHFLLFTDDGVHRRALDAFVRGVLNGGDPAAVMASTIGDVSRFETAFNVYVSRDVFAYNKAAASAKLAREGFTVREMPPVESDVVRAALHVAMNRPKEATALVAEAQAIDPAVGHEVLALIAERDDRRDEVRASLEKAISQKYVSWYAPYRLATLLPANEDQAVRARIAALLEQATTLNPNADDAWAYLGEVRASLGQGDAAISAATQALLLMPASSRHHASLATVYRLLDRRPDATKAAGMARALAKTPSERERAQNLLAAVAKDALAAAPPMRQASLPSDERATTAAAATTPTAPAGTLVPAPVATRAEAAATATAGGSGRSTDVGYLINACFSDNATCRASLPAIAGECNSGGSEIGAPACRNVGYMLDAGIGMPPQPGAAADYYRKGCDRKDEVSCVRLATLQALGRGVPRDVPAAVRVLETSCANDVQEACFRLGVHLSSTMAPVDLTRARQILAASCEADFAESCAWLKKLPQD